MLISCAVLQLLLSKMKMSVGCTLHFSVQSEGFGVQEPLPLEASKAEALFSKTDENDPRIPDVLVVTGHSNFGDGASLKVTSLSRLRVRNEAVQDFTVLVHVINPMDMDFFKEHRCDEHDGEDLKQFQCNCCVGDLFCRVLFCAPCCC